MRGLSQSSSSPAPPQSQPQPPRTSDVCRRTHFICEQCAVCVFVYVWLVTHSNTLRMCAHICHAASNANTSSEVLNICRCRCGSAAVLLLHTICAPSEILASSSALCKRSLCMPRHTHTRKRSGVMILLVGISLCVAACVRPKRLNY